MLEGVIYNEQLIKIPFSSYRLIAICSPKHRFASQKSITINDLVKERLLLREEGSAIRDTFDSALLLHNISINPKWISVNSQALIRAVEQNLGVSILPRILVEDEISRGKILEVPICDLELSNVNHIVFHKDKVQTRTFKSLVEIIKNEVEKL